MDLYGHWYLSQWAMVVAITAVLMGEAADWVAGLHSNHARELIDMGQFLEALCSWFEDESSAQVAEGELIAFRQKGQPAKDYVREFRKIAGHLVAWPERLLIHQFCMGLDRDLWQACVYRGLPPRLNDWFRAAIDLDVGLREFRARGDGNMGQLKKPVERPQLLRETRTAGIVPDPTDRAGGHCFVVLGVTRWDIMPVPQTAAQKPPSGGERARGRTRVTPKRSQVTQTLPGDAETPIREAGVTPSPGRFPVVSGDSDDEDPEDPMKNNQGQLQPCAYTSRKLTPTERGWAIWEKEAFAMRWALLACRPLLEGAPHPFVVWTDHKNLEALQTPRRLSPKQVRWTPGRGELPVEPLPGPVTHGRDGGDAVTEDTYNDAWDGGW